MRLVRATLWLPECTSIGDTYVVCRFCWKEGPVVITIWKKATSIAAMQEGFA